jgi:site-specific DNA recombinase
VSAAPTRLRCAIYTRKSSDEGLDQQFNSLDAQHEACAAYIQSQAGTGWRKLPTRYDDGGFSGGSMDRPALRRLLADIEAGAVDVVVVYKIDRLTRALCDFARMVELFDRHSVSFVSVTQAFNTTTSMGRLTLNVLLSFAQFEREVTGERIRDKVAASKARGLWMGGLPPLGYDLPEPGSRTLRLNTAEADVVRTIFETYRELGSVHAVQRWLDQRGIVSKVFTTRAGRTLGGTPFSRGALFHLLRNRVYLGLIVHKSWAHQGEHVPIVTSELFETVQAMLTEHARRRIVRQDAPALVGKALLTGRVFDADGCPMSPTFSHGARGQVYRYYVSAPLQQGRARGADDQAIRRISAPALEDKVTLLLDRLLADLPASERPTALSRVEVHRTHLLLIMPARLLAAVRLRLLQGETATSPPDQPVSLIVAVPMRMVLRGGRTVISPSGDRGTARQDPALIKALRAAHSLLRLDQSGLPILTATPTSSYLRKVVRLAFLAPDLQQAILTGTQSPDLTLARLLREPIPGTWPEQRAAFRTRT